MNKIIKEIAKMYEVSVGEVKKEIKIAISEGIKNRNITDFSKEFWDSFDDDMPSIESVIAECVKYLVD